MKNTDAALAPLDIFPSSAFPKRKRAQLDRVLQERRVPLMRAASCGAMLALCAIFTVFYGGVSALAWKNGMAIVIDALFSVLSGITLISSLVLAHRLNEEMRGVPQVPRRLRLEADAESSLEHAMLDINLASHRWNDAYRIARENSVDESILLDLRAQRAALEGRRLDVASNLTRFASAAA